MCFFLLFLYKNNSFLTMTLSLFYNVTLSVKQLLSPRIKAMKSSFSLNVVNYQISSIANLNTSKFRKNLNTNPKGLNLLLYLITNHNCWNLMTPTIRMNFKNEKSNIEWMIICYETHLSSCQLSKCDENECMRGKWV